jgi:hypothetical protein
MCVVYPGSERPERPPARRRLSVDDHIGVDTMYSYTDLCHWTEGEAVRCSPILALALAVVGVFLIGCSENAGPTATSASPITASSSPSTTPVAPTSGTVVPTEPASGLSAGRISTQAFGYGSTHDPETMFVDAPIVVAGVIEKVGPARWNSLDGRRWPKDLGTDADMPMLYRLLQVTVHAC